MALVLSVQRSGEPLGDVSVKLGHPLLDDYLVFLAGRARPNAVLAVAFDLKVFFMWAQKEPAEVTTRDIVDFVAARRVVSRLGSRA